MITILDVGIVFCYLVNVIAIISMMLMNTSGVITLILLIVQLLVVTVFYVLGYRESNRNLKKTKR